MYFYIRWNFIPYAVFIYMYMNTAYIYIYIQCSVQTLQRFSRGVLPETLSCTQPSQFLERSHVTQTLYNIQKSIYIYIKVSIQATACRRFWNFDQPQGIEPGHSTFRAGLQPLHHGANFIESIYLWCNRPCVYPNVS